MKNVIAGMAAYRICLCLLVLCCVVLWGVLSQTCAFMCVWKGACMLCHVSVRSEVHGVLCVSN